MNEYTYIGWHAQRSWRGYITIVKSSCVSPFIWRNQGQAKIDPRLYRVLGGNIKYLHATNHVDACPIAILILDVWRWNKVLYYGFPYDLSSVRGLRVEWA